MMIKTGPARQIAWNKKLQEGLRLEIMLQQQQTQRKQFSNRRPLKVTFENVQQHVAFKAHTNCPSHSFAGNNSKASEVVF